MKYVIFVKTWMKYVVFFHFLYVISLDFSNSVQGSQYKREISWALNHVVFYLVYQPLA